MHLSGKASKAERTVEATASPSCAMAWSMSKRSHANIETPLVYMYRAEYQYKLLIKQHTELYAPNCIYMYQYCNDVHRTPIALNHQSFHNYTELTPPPCRHLVIYIPWPG